MQATAQLVRRKAWLEAQLAKVRAELAERGVEVDEQKSKPKPPAKTKPSK